MLEPDSKIICSFIRSLLSKHPCWASPLSEVFGHCRWDGRNLGLPEHLWCGWGRGVLSRGHLLPVCRTEACVQCRAVLFCQRPVCLGSGALCACLPRAPDTGSVLENETSSTCPDPAVLCRLTGDLTGSTSRSFGSSFLCQLHKRSQATERPRKDKPHRDVSQAAGSLCGDTILFPLHQMSAWQPLHSSWWLCAFFHFSLESPPVQDVLSFTFEKAEPLRRAWVTSSRPTAVGRPQSFASGSLSLARGGSDPLCCHSSHGPAAGWLEPPPAWGEASCYFTLTTYLLKTHGFTCGENDLQPSSWIPKPQKKKRN